MSRFIRWSFIAVLAVGTVVAPVLLAPPAVAASSEAETALATLNAYRKSKGLGAVALDSTLTKMAQDLANACAANGNKCDHNTGGSFPSRLKGAGAKAGYGAENLKRNETTIEGAFAWWKGSSIHNSNMLIPQVKKLGFARAPATGKANWVLIVTD